MSSGRKKLRLRAESVSLGCGSCRKPNLCNIFKPKPRPNRASPSYQSRTLCNYFSSSSSSKKTNTDSDTATTFSPTNLDASSHVYNETECSRRVRGLGRVGGESLAVEKDSDDPYLDFRQSMLQMILEKEIYSKDDLRELLNCFLQLNSPYYHGIIVRAFTEIWDGVFSVKPAAGWPSLHYDRT